MSLKQKHRSEEISESISLLRRLYKYTHFTLFIHQNLYIVEYVKHTKETRDMFYKFIDDNVKLNIAYSKDALYKKFRRERRKGTKETLMDFLLNQYAEIRGLKLTSWISNEGNQYLSIKSPNKESYGSYNTTVEDTKEKAKAKEGSKIVYEDDIQTLKRAMVTLAAKIQQLEKTQGRVEKKMLFGSIPLELKFNNKGIREDIILNGRHSINYIQYKTLESASKILDAIGITFEESDS